MQSTLSEWVVVRCPMNQSSSLLEAFFREETEHPPELERHHALRLNLRVPFHTPGGKEEVLAESDVVATLTPVPAPQFTYQKIAVEWKPERGPYPSFSGNITVEAEEDYDAFRLVLTGSYVPPGGAAGAAFDMVFGRRIAVATAHDLLARIREAIERGHAVIEEEKHNHRKAAGGE